MDRQLADQTVTSKPKNGLPKEMIVAILRQLNLPELISCRMVSKQFKDLIACHLKIRELFLFAKNLPQLDFTFSTPNFRYLLRSDSDILRLPSFQSFFSVNLRSLSICTSIEHPRCLNQFPNLERLYARRIIVHRKTKLSLSKLRVLLVAIIESKKTDQQMNERTSLVIDSKVLEKLNCGSLHCIKLTRYDTVRKLTVLDFVFRPSYLSSFKRLRVLRIRMMQADHDVDARVKAIAALEDLAELHFRWYHSILDMTRERVSQTLQQIQRMKPELRIFLFDVEVTRENSERLIGQPLTDWQEVFKMQMENYQQLIAPLKHYSVVYYHHLANLQKRTQLEHFFDRFCNIRSVHCGLIKNSNQFAWFVNSCRDLSFLRFNVWGLERSFFDRLSLNRRNLHDLTLAGKNPEIDCNFILRLDYLWFLQIEQPLDLQTVIAFVGQCKYLQQLNFVARSIRFASCKSGDDRYQLSSKSDPRCWSDLSLRDWTELCALIFSEAPLTRSGAKRLKVDANGRFVYGA